MSADQAPGLTPAESKVLDHLSDAWKAFCELPWHKEDDRTEFRHGLHALQNHIAVRIARRVAPGNFSKAGHL